MYQMRYGREYIMVHTYLSVFTWTLPSSPTIELHLLRRQIDNRGYAFTIQRLTFGKLQMSDCGVDPDVVVV